MTHTTDLAIQFVLQGAFSVDNNSVSLHDCLHRKVTQDGAVVVKVR